MIRSLSINQQAGALECPNCKKTINTLAQQCPFCSTPIDPGAAEENTETLARVSDACIDADQVRQRESEVSNYPGLDFLVVTPMKFLWWVKYGALHTLNPDFVKAENDMVESDSPSLLIVRFVSWCLMVIGLVAFGIWCLLHLPWATA